MSEEQPKFTVDTHLFRELGELLVGRDSTALIELIKNAYDADATNIKVVADKLDEPDSGYIEIIDNGLGMTRAQFERGFLRIASRMKEEGARRSPRFGRRYTGEKGIGRLAAHKLARKLQVESVSSDPQSRKPLERISATIDWDRIEQDAETLDQVPADAVLVEQSAPGRKPTPGTRIILTRLRRKWTNRERIRFVSEAQSTRPPEILTKPLDRDIAAGPSLFSVPRVRSEQADASSDWDLKLEGEFDVGESYWQALAESAAWIIEIDATSPEGVQYKVTPTLRFLKETPNASPFQGSYQPPEGEDCPRFQARILVRHGAIQGQSSEVTSWARGNHGIRVFMESFRVLPYGESGDDWLGLDRQYAQRDRGVSSIAKQLLDSTEEAASDADALLTTFPNRQCFGGVFLTHEGAPSLQMLVNREGFVPNNAFLTLQEIVKGGMELCVRAHAAARRSEREKRKAQRELGAAERVADRQKQGQAAKRSNSALAGFEKSVDDGLQLLKELRAAVPEEETKQTLAHVETLLLQPAQAARDELGMIRVLASVGTQMAGFVHELNGLLGLASKIEATVNKLREQWRTEDPAKARRLARVASTLGDLRRSLERQASYLTEIVTPDARRRRSRQRLSDCFDKSLDLVVHEAEKRSIKISNKIPEELKSPPMFRAELVAVFSNLITNAIKAAGSGGRVQATGKPRPEGGAIIRIQNTGVAVDVERGEQWFHPFASTTSKVDVTLGQGMGLGLPITRSILEEYSASIAFVSPTAKYATAVQIEFPK
ncbi:ATP-binding protein [Haliangium ochraceum]|uniref:histidine kinase n=1 Tax=Haliangium ochraceum (strain DSM 14365 / JCM 11303 / SMP-2) TaxID=502025 RepID=D0LJH3_HALO1|nr:ATP-binding protein [Haliangium ochraceum]ACY16547.1 histidine kinase [Haliangium ochraceum DSM 14365]